MDPLPGISSSTSRAEIDSLNKRSWSAALNDPRSALELAEDAIARAAKESYTAGTAAGLLNAGWALIYTGEYDSALKRLHEGLDVYQSQGDTEGKLKCLNAMGVIAHRVGDSERALERYRETLEIARETGNTERRIAALNNLGELSESLNHHSDAMSYFDEAHEAAVEFGDDSVLAVVMVNLASVHHHLGDGPAALECAREGVSLARTCGDRIAEAEGLTVAGLILSDLGDTSAAEQHHRDAIRVAEETGHPHGIATALTNLGTLHIALNDLESASSELERATEISESIGTPLATLPAYRKLAQLHEDAGDLGAAVSSWKKIQALVETVFSERVLKRMTAMRTEHELEQSRAQAEIFRLKNVELRETTEQLQIAGERMRTISEIGREVTASLEMSDLTEILYRRINTIMDAVVFGIAVFDSDERTLDYTLFIEDGQRITPFTRSVDDKNSFAAWSVRNCKEIVIQDAAKQYRTYVEERTPFSSKHSKSMVFLPLTLGDRVVGVLTVQSRKRHGYTETQIDLLRALGSYIAIGLDNSRKHSLIQDLNASVTREKAELEKAYGRIEHLANHDSLTELPNRRLFAELLTRHIPLARRQRKKFGLLYLDLDDFKPINDTFGHATGDTVLVRVSERLQSTVRSSDTVARIGGDEFVLIVRDIEDSSGLQAIAVKVLESIQMPFRLGEQVCSLGASIGMSMFPRDGESAELLLKAADLGMYEAKSRGKHRIAFAPRAHSHGRADTAESSISSPSKTN